MWIKQRQNSIVWRVGYQIYSLKLISAKKRDVTESRYGQTISSRSSSRVLEQVDDQGKVSILLGIYVRGWSFITCEGGPAILLGVIFKILIVYVKGALLGGSFNSYESGI